MLSEKEKYLNYLKSLDYSAETINSRITVFKDFEKYMIKSKIDPVNKSLDKKIFEEYYLYLKNYTYKKADNKKTGYLRDKKLRKYKTHKLDPVTILSRMGTMKDYIKYLFEHEKIYENPFEKIDLGTVSDKLKSDISEKDVEKLVSVINTQTFLGYRDRTLIELIYSTGLRRKEVFKLNVNDINLVENIIIVRLGKGKKDRIIPLGEVAKAYLKEYLLKIRKYMVGVDNLYEQALFLNSKGKRIGVGSIGRIIRIHARAAGVYHIHTHKLRHAFALHMMKKGCDIRYIQEILGHEMLETTTVYTKVFDYDLKEKVLKYHPRDYKLKEKIDIKKIKDICENNYSRVR